MPQINWRKWLVVGLSCSLFVDSVGSITALAETITSESPPTVASSTQETTTETSTTSNPATTDTSQEEVTKEAEKQVSTEVKEIQKEESQAEVKQEETPANSSESDLQKSISPRWVPNNQVIYPRMTFAFTDETGKAFADEALTLSGTYYKLARHTATSQWRAYADRYPIVSSNAGGGQYRVAVNAAVPLPYDFFTNLPVGYNLNIYTIEQLKIDNTLKYVDNIATSTATATIRTTSYINQQVSETPQFGNQGNRFVGERGNKFSKNSTNVFSLSSVTNTTNHEELLNLLQVGSASNGTNPIVILYGFDGTATYRETVNYVVTRKQVTEKFVDANGVAITPPTGFTQNKKTPMTSNTFTFKQAGTLPDTYTTGGKTYRFKGWYKGRTKPSTLTTTKAPSYAVTYDGNDDLTVMYEEVVARAFPAVNYQFGFVSEAGTLISSADISITYDYFLGEWRNTAGTMTWNTLQANQSATNVGSVKNVLMPAISIPQSKEQGDDNRNVAANFSIVLPRYYKTASLYDKTGKISTKYPLPTITLTNGVGNTNETEANVINLLKLTQRADNSLTPGETYSVSAPDPKYVILTRRTNGYQSFSYRTMSAPAYYHLTNRRVTENFVDTSSTKITAPSGFTQGKQTVINSDPYTFKQAGTLPDTYTAGGKTYKFKGWYKGKTKTEPLTTTKAPSYPVTYDDNDDLNVVYEEVKLKTYTLPSQEITFGYVDEQGNLIDPANVTVKATMAETTDVDNGTTTTFPTLTGVDVTTTKLKKLTVPQKVYSLPESGERLTTYGTQSVTHEIPKYYQTISISPTSNYTGDKTKYPLANEVRKDIENPSTIVSTAVGTTAYSLTKQSGNVYNTRQVPWNWDKDRTRYAMGIYSGNAGRNYNLAAPDKTIYYYLENRRVTENFVDTSGAKITAPTGFTQGNQIPMTSDTFKYTAAKALPATYTAGGKVYTFQGWYKGKTKPSTLDKTTTPTFNTTFDDNDDMTAIYQEEVPTAEASMTGIVTVIPSGNSQLWRMTIKNTGKVPLTSLTVKPTANWSQGLARPTQLSVRVGTTTAKNIPVTEALWTSGIPLDVDIPVGGSALVQLPTTVTGQPLEVLQAELALSGNMAPINVSSSVRIQGSDQEVTDPVGEGFISVPTFDFGQVGVAGVTTQHGLKKAADYYGNGTRNPFVRIKKTQPNWSLTAQLSQPQSAKDSLPTATRLLLGRAAVSEVDNYNLVTEVMKPVGTTPTLSLTANNAVTNVITDKQFTGNDVYQLDFDFNNVKLEVPANQGMKGEQYNATVTWNLVTGP
ncbi:WxL domain-containing protein [Enterococcus faecalis]|nr:WxL domain-containing protein [Enterococcus faecalis]